MEYTHNEYGDMLLKLCALLVERMLIHWNSHCIILFDVIQNPNIETDRSSHSKGRGAERLCHLWRHVTDGLYELQAKKLP